LRRVDRLAAARDFAGAQTHLDAAKRALRAAEPLLQAAEPRSLSPRSAALTAPI
jgi:hypothetical protein